jgi:hypothetical protein
VFTCSRLQVPGTPSLMQFCSQGLFLLREVQNNVTLTTLTELLVQLKHVRNKSQALLRLCFTVDWLNCDTQISNDWSLCLYSHILKLMFFFWQALICRSLESYLTLSKYKNASHFKCNCIPYSVYPFFYGEDGTEIFVRNVGTLRHIPLVSWHMFCLWELRGS